jgi:hypothetical protein
MIDSTEFRDHREEFKRAQRVASKKAQENHWLRGDIAKLEVTVRNLAIDRDRWKRRAEVAEAELKYLDVRA